MKIPHGAAFTFATVLLVTAGTALTPLPGAAHKEDSLKVAELLDAVVQPRFQRNQGRFGTGRATTIAGHGNVIRFEATTPAEAELLNKVDGYKCSYLLAFLHTTHLPGASINLVPKPFLNFLVDKHVNYSPYWDRDSPAKQDDLERVVMKYLPSLRVGDPKQTVFENRLIVMRPVKALQASCLSCHTDAKLGDTLGIMVYAVDKDAGDAKR